MKKELQQRLFSTYPELFYKALNPKSMDSIKYGIQTEDGWFEVIDKMCEDIFCYCKQNSIPFPMFTIIKEKYGNLCIQACNTNDCIEVIIAECICSAENICECCGGEHARLKTLNCSNDVRYFESIIKTLCDECFKTWYTKFANERISKAYNDLSNMTKEASDIANALMLSRNGECNE